MPHLTFLALHPPVAVLAVLAVVAPVPGQAVAVLVYGLASVTVETSHPTLGIISVIVWNTFGLMPFLFFLDKIVVVCLPKTEVFIVLCIQITKSKIFLVLM